MDDTNTQENTNELELQWRSKMSKNFIGEGVDVKQFSFNDLNKYRTHNNGITD